MLDWRAVLVACAACSSAPALAQKIDLAKSEITFTIRQMGVPVVGRFAKFNGQLSFDPHSPNAGKVSLSIDTGSAKFDSPDTDAEAAKPSWLSAGRFPAATLESTGVRNVGAGKYEVAGKLSIKGAARDVLVPVALVQTGTTALATGAFSINRLEFKVGDGEWSDPSLVANEVLVKFKLALTEMRAP